MKYELIFFDLDGTLVDSLDDLSNSLNYSLNKYGFPSYSKETVKKFIGNGAKELIRKSFNGKNISLHDTLNLFLSDYSDNCTVKTKPYDGVVETLEKLNTINIVLTNKPLVMSEKIINNLGLKKYFKEIIAPETFGVKKPDPLPVFKILKKYNILPENSLLIGDSITDIDCGISSGIKVIAVDYGFSEKNELKNAFKIIKNFKELLDII